MSNLARRACIRLIGAVGAGLAGLMSTAGGEAASPTRAATPALTRAGSSSTVRLLSVVSPVDGGLLPSVIPDFERLTGHQVVLSTAEDVYGPARKGQADVVLSHYGHVEVDSFVLQGFGRWPRPVFSNQLALLGPPEDPAQVRDLSDLVEAFRRIAEANAPYVVNDIENVKYLGEILWNAAGQPPKQAWYVDQNLRMGAAVQAAAELQGYTIWGLTPFLRAQEQAQAALAPVVLDDPLLQRLMVTVVVKPQQVAGVNEQGAMAFERYLLAPATQARMRAVRVTGIDQQVWWPAGRSNETSVLPS